VSAFDARGGALPCKADFLRKHLECEEFGVREGKPEFLQSLDALILRWAPQAFPLVIGRREPCSCSQERRRQQIRFKTARMAHVQSCFGDHPSDVRVEEIERVDHALQVSMRFLPVGKMMCFKARLLCERIESGTEGSASPREVLKYEIFVTIV
jgi:hypothetical protein